jgi:hypothetical protein
LVSSLFCCFKRLELAATRCRLNKAIYGLKQPLRAWYSKLSSKLQMLGFVPSKGVTSLLFFSKEGIPMYILVYVDDSIVVSSSSTATNALLRNLEKNFVLKDLGDLHYFLGNEVNKINDSILLSQSKYAMDILKRAGMAPCKPVNTPLSTYEKLSAPDGEELSPIDATNY